MVEKNFLIGVQEVYSKNLKSLQWSGARWRKMFSSGENEKHTNVTNYSTGNSIKTA